VDPGAATASAPHKKTGLAAGRFYHFWFYPGHCRSKSLTVLSGGATNIFKTGSRAGGHEEKKRGLFMSAIFDRFYAQL
jgi:hypothetical protein